MLINYHYHGNSLNILPSLVREGRQWGRAFQQTAYWPVVENVELIMVFSFGHPYFLLVWPEHKLVLNPKVFSAG